MLLLWSELIMKGELFLTSNETKGREDHKTIGSSNPSTRGHTRMAHLAAK